MNYNMKMVAAILLIIVLSSCQQPYGGGIRQATDEELAKYGLAVKTANSSICYGLSPNARQMSKVLLDYDTIPFDLRNRCFNQIAIITQNLSLCYEIESRHKSVNENLSAYQRACIRESESVVK